MATEPGLPHGCHGLEADGKAILGAFAAGQDDGDTAAEAAKAAQTSEGVAIAVELVEAAKTMVNGIYLMPPFKRNEMVPEIMRGAGIMPSQTISA